MNNPNHDPIPGQVACATGHRPKRLGGHGSNVEDQLRRVAFRMLEYTQPSSVYIGMALGWDTVLGECALEQGITIHAAIPFKGQERVWPLEAQRRYGRLLEQCQTITDVSKLHGEQSVRACMFKRDEFMVQRSTLVLALFDGVERGGTWHAVRFARDAGVRVVNGWAMFSSAKK